MSENASIDKIAGLIEPYELDGNTRDQLFGVAKEEHVTHVAAMPDMHLGYDMPIGGVALSRDYITPAWIGFDIACGMYHLDTGKTPQDLDLDTLEKRRDLFARIEEDIPTGFYGRSRPADIDPFQSALGDNDLERMVSEKMAAQLGTLGGGNHFIQIGLSRRGTIAVTIHSGSRNPGKTIAEYYMDQPAKHFKLGTPLAGAYIQDMQQAAEFAVMSKHCMMQSILELMGFAPGDAASMIASDSIYAAHNWAEFLDRDHVLHRKGAISAREGEFGIIPGDIVTGVYVVKGLGNGDYLWSASHGAGRQKSRNKAKKEIDLETFREETKHIVCRAEQGTLEEAPGAYKDLDFIIRRQEGVVIDVVDFCEPLIVVKGQKKK